MKWKIKGSKKTSLQFGTIMSDVRIFREPEVDSACNIELKFISMHDKPDFSRQTLKCDYRRITGKALFVLFCSVSSASNFFLSSYNVLMIYTSHIRYLKNSPKVKACQHLDKGCMLHLFEMTDAQ